MTTVSDVRTPLISSLRDLMTCLKDYATALNNLYISGTDKTPHVRKAIRVLLRDYARADAALTHFQLKTFDQWAQKITEGTPYRAASDRAVLLQKAHTGPEYKLLLEIAFLHTKITMFFMTILMLVQQLIVRDLSLPPTVKRLRRSERLGRGSLLLTIVLTILAFVKLSPSAAFVMAVIGLAFFLTQQFWLADLIVIGVSFPGRVALEARTALKELEVRIETLQKLLDSLSANLPVWPKELDTCLDQIERSVAQTTEDLDHQSAVAQRFLDGFSEARDNALRSVGMLPPSSGPLTTACT